MVLFIPSCHISLDKMCILNHIIRIKISAKIMIALWRRNFPAIFNWEQDIKLHHLSKLILIISSLWKTLYFNIENGFFAILISKYIGSAKSWTFSDMSCSKCISNSGCYHLSSSFIVLCGNVFVMCYFVCLFMSCVNMINHTSYHILYKYLVPWKIT